MTVEDRDAPLYKSEHGETLLHDEASCAKKNQATPLGMAWFNLTVVFVAVSGRDYDALSFGGSCGLNAGRPPLPFERTCAHAIR